MKLRLLALITLGFGLQAAAQAIPNGGFENWIDQGDYEEPQFWGTPNIVSSFGADAPVTKVTDAHSGNFAVQMETIEFENPFMPGQVDTIPGGVLLGTLDILSDEIGGYPFTSRPDSIVFWYKYDKQPGDEFGVAAELSYWDGSDHVIIGGFEWSSPVEASSYSRVALPIEYFSTEMPDSLVLIFGSSTQEIVGSVLTVDDVSAFYNATVSVSNVKATEPIKLYPNPAKDELNVTLAKDATVSIYNVLGAHIETIRISANQNTQIQTEKYNNGVYILKTNTGITQRFVVKH